MAVVFMDSLDRRLTSEMAFHGHCRGLCSWILDRQWTKRISAIAMDMIGKFQDSKMVSLRYLRVF